MSSATATVELKPRSPLPLMGVSRRARAAFYIQLARMLSAGLGPPRALSLLAGQGGSLRLRRAARAMAAHTAAGGSLPEAFAAHPNLFPPNEVRMIEASARAGRLPEVLQRVAASLERLAATRSKIISGMIYPGFCLFAAFVGLPLVVTYLTRPSAAFVGLVETYAARIVGGACGFVGLFVLYRLLADRTGLSRVFHFLALRLPLFGKLNRRAALGRFADAFQCLYASGVLLPEALERAALACGNAYIGSRLARVVGMVRDGVPLSEALRQSGVIPVVGLNLVETGEQAGELAASLQKFRDYQQEELVIGLDRLSRILPMLAIFAMIVVLAAAVLAAWSKYIGGITNLMGQ